MASSFRLRTIFAPIVKVLAKIGIKLHISPNQATWIMLFSSILASILLIFTRNLLLFGILIFITGLLDGVDGAIARFTDKTSKFGGFFDSTMDRISEVIIFCSIIICHDFLTVFNFQIDVIILGIALVFSQLISYTKARCELTLNEEERKNNALKIGLMGQSERLFLLFILSILGFFLGSVWFSWGLILFCGLVIFTFIQRMVIYQKIIQKSSSP